MFNLVPTKQVALRLAKNELNTRDAAHHQSIYVTLVVISAVFTLGTSLLLEGIMVFIMYVMNAHHDRQDFKERLSLVSAQALVSMNIWAFVVGFIAGFFSMGVLAPVAGLLVALAFHARRLDAFQQIVQARVPKLRPPLELQTEADRLALEASELRQLQREQTRAQQLRHEVDMLRTHTNTFHDMAAARHDALSTIAQAQKLYERGMYTHDELRYRVRDVVYSFDWTEQHVSPEHILGELWELRQMGALGDEEVQFIKQQVMAVR